MKPNKTKLALLIGSVLALSLIIGISYNSGRNAEFKSQEQILLEKGIKIHHPKTGEVIWKDSLKVDSVGVKK